MTVFGPYDTETQAAAEPLATEVRAVPLSNKPGGVVAALQLSHLREACTDAGVELGRFDARILAWLATYEATTVQVVVGLISRAHAAGAKQTAGVREIAQRWVVDPGAFPDGAAEPLGQIANLLGVRR
ncbi:hypothetical protein Q0Z83_060480 [Actinoplanes sichuanensis]|uniref:Uncharacterized protein n=1 Tax=Actinoplanes sichuanensis TaxID=512349 RepID=A0ABW4A789_9ACTN|nr:hypothetical protein [Actinoplanes sichuanensis]BEL07857.1 hypothetical protein Q0Z83_060480 [Actinoplanes sichuanensis]